MTSMTMEGGPWRLPAPMHTGAGVRLLPARADRAGEPIELLPGAVGRGGDPTGELVGAGVLGLAGAGALVGSAGAAGAGALGIGKGLGIALGVGAVAGAAFLLHRAAGQRTSEYVVHFAAEPQLDGVAPGDVYATLRAHHEQHAPAVERELQALVAEEKVRSYSGIIGSNGFVVEVVNAHRDEVQRRLAALHEVGAIDDSPFG